MSIADLTGRDGWSGVRAVVAGFDAAGFSAADNLLHLGADVVVLDPASPAGETAEKAELLGILGADMRLGQPPALPEDAALLVASPAWPAESPVLSTARERGIPVWGELELAWRLRGPDPAPWLVVAGTQRQPTAELTTAILVGANVRARLVGEIGTPVIEAVMDPEPTDVLVVATSPAHLRDVGSMLPDSTAVVGLGSEAWGPAYEGVRLACVYDAEDPAAENLVRDAEVQEGARAIGLTSGVPGVGMLGVVDDVIADRAFVAERQTSAAELATTADVPAGAELTTVLAAAALARSHGVPAIAVRDTLRGM